MFFKLIGTFFFIGMIGFGVFTYTQYLDSKYKKNELKLMEEIRILKRTSNLKESNKLKKESQLNIEYKTLKKKLEDSFIAQTNALKKKYGSFSSIENKIKTRNMAAKKDLMQREKGLKRLQAKLAKREKAVKYQEKKNRKKANSLKNIKMECRVFDLRKIDQSVKEFQTVAYATRDRVNILCGFDPSSKRLANKSSCLQGRKDRERARSLLSLINATAGNVKQKKSYRQYVRTQRYRMQISK